MTNLPAPDSEQATTSDLPTASLGEVVRLYSLRMWVEQSYTQVKHALGWAQYQVRADGAIRRHWQLVWCAFSFWWWHHSHAAGGMPSSTRWPWSNRRSSLRLLKGWDGKKSSAPAPRRPQVSWPMALKQVRAWLEPWIMLWRYWRGWSKQPPPPELQALLDWVWQGTGSICMIPLDWSQQSTARWVRRQIPFAQAVPSVS